MVTLVSPMIATGASNVATQSTEGSRLSFSGGAQASTNNRLLYGLVRSGLCMHGEYTSSARTLAAAVHRLSLRMCTPMVHTRPGVRVEYLSF